MANLSTLIEDFTATSIPATLSVAANDAGGSISYPGGRVDFVTPNNPGNVTLQGIAAYDFDAVYVRIQPPVSQEPYGGGYFVFDASFDGYGMSVSSTSTTPDSATSRANRYIAGAVTHKHQITFDNVNHKWFRCTLTGGTTVDWYTAPDGANNGPGSWTSMGAADTIGTDNPGFSPTGITFYFGASTSQATGQGKTFSFDGLNGPTAPPFIPVGRGPTREPFSHRMGD